MFDRTEALEAMYELKRQGYTQIGLRFTDNGELMLFCGNNHNNFMEYPNINLDSIDDWSQHSNDFNPKYVYWWIFD